MTFILFKMMDYTFDIFEFKDNINDENLVRYNSFSCVNNDVL